MSNRDTLQLAFDFNDSPTSRAGSFVVTRVLRTHRLCNTVMERARYVRRFFPELGEQPIRVGLTRAASGMAVPGGNEVWFNPNRLSYHTITHEFMHLLQGKFGIPSGERSCDVFSMARHWTLNDTAPYYVRVPSKMMDGKGKVRPAAAQVLYNTAVEAVQLRRAGKRNYIAYFEKKLRDAAARPADPEGIGLHEPELRF